MPIFALGHAHFLASEFGQMGICPYSKSVGMGTAGIGKLSNGRAKSGMGMPHSHHYTQLCVQVLNKYPVTNYYTVFRLADQLVFFTLEVPDIEGVFFRYISW